MTKAETARQAALERVGDAYVYGAWDQQCTVANRNKYAYLSPGYADAIENQCQRMSKGKSTCDGCRWQGHRIHDCRGLTSTCAGAAGIAVKGQTVARQWAEDVWAVKGEIGDLPKDVKYAQLFRHNGSKWAHTGVYIGGGETVDARGHSYGVIRRKLADYKWTHYAIPRGMDGTKPEEGQSMEPYYAIVETKSGPLNMRSGPGTGYPVIFKIPKGTPLDVLAEFDTDGDGKPDWAFVDEDGTQGYVSCAYIAPVQPSAPADSEPIVEPGETHENEPETVYAVVVTTKDRAFAETLAKTYSGSILASYKPPDVKGD